MFRLAAYHILLVSSAFSAIRLFAAHLLIYTSKVLIHDIMACYNLSGIVSIDRMYKPVLGTFNGRSYVTCASPKMHLIYPPKFCISIVFNFFWDGCNCQEK